MQLIIKGKDRMAGSVTNAWTNQRARCCTKGGISGRLVKAAGKETFYPGAFRHFFHLGQSNGGAGSLSFFFFFIVRDGVKNVTVETQCDTVSLNRWVWPLMWKSWRQQTVTALWRILATRSSDRPSSWLIWPDIASSKYMSPCWNALRTTKGWFWWLQLTIITIIN